MNAPLRYPLVERRTIADLVRDLGQVPLDRILMSPPPGTATIDDVEPNKGSELVDGTLVEKAMGLLESFLGAYLIRLLDSYAEARNLGMVSGEEGGMQILTGLVRKPDVAFISWDRFLGRKLTKDPYPALAPDLAVEILSANNTAAEMARKREEYFAAGVRLVWMVDRFTRTIAVYTSPTQFRTLTESDTLDGGDVLPGFAVEVRDIFARLNRFQ